MVRIRKKGGEGGSYLINEVSRLVNLSQKRIREYEAEGFIKPLREANTNNRLYTDFEVRQIQQLTSLIHDRGFTLAGLRQVMILAPCWNIFDCPDKKECPAYLSPWSPCYEVRTDRLAEGFCPRCPIYLNRDVKKERVLVKFPPEPDSYLHAHPFVTPTADST